MDDTLRSVPVWTPPGDRAADCDPAVELRMKALGRKRATYLGTALVDGLIGAWLIQPGDPALILGGLLLAAAVVLVAAAVVFQLRWGRWLPPVRMILRTGIPRRVQAQIISAKGQNAFLALDGGLWQVRVRGLHRDARAVIARTGHVWLAGPDDNGIAVLFADGLPVPVPAQVVTEAPATQAPEPVVPASMLVADDALPASFARRYVTAQWLALSIWAVLIVALLVDGTSGVRLGLAIGVAGLVAVLVRRLRPALRMRSLLKDGRWQAFQARTHTWQGDPQLHGDLGVTLTRPEGGELPAVIRLASVDLVANIVSTGLLWVNGTPMMEDTRAVGVPGLPIAASAQFVHDPKLH